MAAITSSINVTNFEQKSIKNFLKTKINTLTAYQTILNQKISNINGMIHTLSGEIKTTCKELKKLGKIRRNLKNHINIQKLNLIHTKAEQYMINHLSKKIAIATSNKDFKLLTLKKLEKTKKSIMKQSFDVVDEIVFLGEKIRNINLSIQS